MFAALTALRTVFALPRLAPFVTLGGYQVIKKWLSYREKALLGRGLTKEEARHVTDMVRRIAALLLMGPALDANYAAVKRDAYLGSSPGVT